MQTRKVIYLILLLSAAAVSVQGLDVGFTLNSVTGARQGSEPGIGFSHADTVSFWGVRARGQSPIGYRWRVWYRYNLDRPVAFELDELYMTARLEGESAVTALRVGRFTHRDWGRVVFNHGQDGVRATLSGNAVDMRLYAGTTALVAGHRSTIFLSPLDSQNRDALFGSPRLISSAALRLPSLLAGITPTIEALGQFELRSGDVAYHSQYVTLDIDSSVGGGFSLGTTGSVMAMQIEQEDSESLDLRLGYLGRIDMRYVRPALSGLSLLLRGWYASGEQSDGQEIGDFSVGAFRPVSMLRVTSVLPVQIDGTFGGRVQASLRPFSGESPIWLQDTQVSLYGVPLFRTSEQSQLITQVDEDSSNLYMGSEIGTSLAMRPASDFGLRIGGGVFIAGDALIDDSIRWQASADLSFSF